MLLVQDDGGARRRAIPPHGAKHDIELVLAIFGKGKRYCLIVKRQQDVFHDICLANAGRLNARKAFLEV